MAKFTVTVYPKDKPVAVTTNQCDGCRRGLPLVNGIHKGSGYDMIGCTKGRYKEST